MSEPRDNSQLTPDERHLIALLRQGPQAPQRLAETLGLTLEHTLNVLQCLFVAVTRSPHLLSALLPVLAMSKYV